MIIAAFNEKDTYVTIYGLYQYDYGQVLRIQGLNLPSAVEMHFALQDKGGESITRVGTTKDGVTDVLIPDSMLENNGTSSDYKIYVFVYIADEISGKTERRIEMSVKSRPKPEAFDRPEDTELFRDAIKAVNESAARSAESERQAEGWAHGREDLPEREQDNAKYYSEQAKEDSAKTDADRKEVERLVESVSGVDEQVETIRGYLEQAQTSATNAALSESAAKESENNAAQARAGAEVAEDNAELAAQKAGQDKTAVEKAANLVKQISQEVLDNKNLVDDTVHGFELRTQQAVADVNNAGQSQTERIHTAGNAAVESVESAQRTATGAVETAKTEAIKTVQEEGVAQTGTVAAEGEKQVQAVQAAASEIVADRQQIQKNSVDIEYLGHNKADAIVSSASGEQIVLNDSDNEPFKGLHVYGKSTQVTTTGAQLFDVDAGGTGWLNQETGAFEVNNSNYVSEYIPVKSGAQYYINYDISQYVYSYDSSKQFLRKETYKNSFAVGDDVFYIRFGISNNKEVALKKAKTIMLNEGSSAKPYEPYTGGKPSPSIEYPQEIVSMGDKGEIGVSVYGGNLIPETQIVDISFNKKDNGTHYGYSEWIKVIPDNTYIFNENMIVKIVDTLGNTLFNGQTSSKKVIIPHDGVRLKCRTVVGIDILGSDFKLMMNIGDKILPFEPYKEPQTLTLSTPNGLSGIPVSTGGNYTDSNGQQWVCDEKDLAREKYVQRVEKAKFDGSADESWAVSNSHLGNRYVSIPLKNRSKSQHDVKIICNIAFPKLWNVEKTCFINEYKYFSYYDNSAPASIFENVDNFKQWLIENPIEILYILETPIERDLTPEEVETYKALHTNYPTTVIMNDENAGMKVSYVADTKHYIDKKFKELNQAIVNTQISLL